MTRLSFRISRYGVTKTSLGIARCQRRREGFPDMSRFSIVSREAVGQVFTLPDKEFRYLRTVLILRPGFLYAGGRHIEGRLRWSLMRAASLIPPSHWRMGLPYSLRRFPAL